MLRIRKVLVGYFIRITHRDMRDNQKEKKNYSSFRQRFDSCRHNIHNSSSRISTPYLKARYLKARDGKHVAR